MLNHHDIQFQCSIICQVVAYGSLKTKENFKLLILALKVVVVAQPRSQGPLLLGHGGRVGEDPGNEVGGCLQI